MARLIQTLKALLPSRAEVKQQAFVPNLLQSWASWLWSPPRSNYNYGAELGMDLFCSCVTPVVQWLMRTFPEAQLIVQERDGDEWVPVPDHALTRLVARPNRYYEQSVLWMSTVFDWAVYGESYWHVLSTRGGQPGELWWVPPWCLRPEWPADGREFISHYTYTPQEGSVQELGLDEVVHFRHALDPRNPRHGLPPLRAVLRDIWSDEEASNYVASLLRNSAVSSTLITPDPAAGPAARIPDAQAEVIKAYVTERFTGDSRGLPMILQGPLKVQRLGFSPTELDVSTVRNIAEERVCAALGPRPAVVGFGTGLEQTRVGAPQPLSAGVWTPQGPTTMGALARGDLIAIPDGWGTVEQIYPQGEQDIYRITFQDGSTAESTLDHLWQVYTPNQGWRIESLATIAAWPAWKLKRTTVPQQGTTHFAETPVLIPPYVLGLLLADGSFRRNLFFSAPNPEIVETIRTQVQADYEVNQTTPGGYDYRIAYRDASKGRGKGGGTGYYNPFISELRRLGLWMLTSPEKFIPPLYKYNSVEVRRQLLQGIMDGDGFLNLHGHPAIEQTSQRLADDITEIVQSLGGFTLRSIKHANRNLRQIKGHWFRSEYDRVHLSILIENEPLLFGAVEKRERCIPCVKHPRRAMRSIEFSRREHAQCIRVHGGLYLTDHFIVTHNTMHEEVGMSWTNALIPMQRVMASTLGQRLLPLFEDDPDQFRLDWDYSRVKALQDDQLVKAQTISAKVAGGWYRVDEARTADGLESEPTDQVYLRSFSVSEVPWGEPQAPKPAPLPFGTPPEGDEDGQEDEAEDEATPEAAAAKGRGIQFKAGEEVIMRLAGRLEGELRRRFLAAVEMLRAQMDVERLHDALRRFDAELAAGALPWETFEAQFGGDARSVLRQAVGGAGALAAQALGGIGIHTRFDLTNPNAVAWAEARAGHLIRDISANTQAGIQRLVASSMRGEFTWQQVARQVRQMVGLTEKQALAVQQYELRLRAEGIPGDRLAARVQRYADLQLRRRAETIARTELITAANQGQILSWQAAMLEGLLDREMTYKVWQIDPDEELDECDELDGTEVLLHETFPGGFAAPPAHPNCKCSIALVFHEAPVAVSQVPSVAAE